jgi:phage tail-like protein
VERSLTVQLDGTVIQTVPLEGPTLTVGRLPGNGLTLPHPLVSRHHATLHLESGQLVLIDAGSTNGTFVDNERLLPDQPHVLAPGESFRIGPFVMTYQGAEAEEFGGESGVVPAPSDDAAVEPGAVASAAAPSVQEDLVAPPVAGPSSAPVPVPATGEVAGAEEGPAAGPEALAVAEQAAEPVAEHSAEFAAEQGTTPAPPEQAEGAEGAALAPAGQPAERRAPPPDVYEPPLTIAPAEPGGALSAPPNGHVAAELAPALAVPAVEPVALIGRMPGLTSLAWPGPARPTAIAPLPCRTASAYLNDLPAIYQDGDFLGRFLLIFESIWEPLEQRQDHMALYFDPRTCPAGFLPWLGSWLEFSVNPHWPEARLRYLLGEAMDLYRWRGTRYGLTRLIEICTGLTPVITEPPETPFVFHVELRLPPDTTVSRELVEQLVQAHKPAHAGYVLDIRP